MGTAAHPGCRSVRPRAEHTSAEINRAAMEDLTSFKCRSRGAICCARGGRAPLPEILRRGLFSEPGLGFDPFNKREDRKLWHSRDASYVHRALHRPVPQPAGVDVCATPPPAPVSGFHSRGVHFPHKTFCHVNSQRLATSGFTSTQSK
jgi:hypothetical protein